jgi:3-hydroxybutyryl-CoA dehydrogenase
MAIFIQANSDQEQEIRKKRTNANVEVIFSERISQDKELGQANAFFILNQLPASVDFSIFGDKPVFVNSVIETLKEINAGKNIYRINGWPGFLQRETWEVAGEKEGAGKIFDELGWNIILVKDKPGLVAARVISMVINEAFFALEEKISTKEEIDMAMKLGTNYPFGPFEWAEKIGGHNIARLLIKLTHEDKRYQPAAALIAETL